METKEKDPIMTADGSENKETKKEKDKNADAKKTVGKDAKKTDEEKALRSEAIQKATLFASEVPLETMKASARVFELCRQMVAEGNPNSVSDAGVGALAARAAVIGAGMNVKINAASLKDRAKAEALIAEAEEIIAKANAEEKEITEQVEKIIKG